MKTVYVHIVTCLSKSRVVDTRARLEAEGGHAVHLKFLEKLLVGSVEGHCDLCDAEIYYSEDDITNKPNHQKMCESCTVTFKQSLLSGQVH
jgi:hypothetical protein